ncbi:hypothetical protein H0H92_001871, partial [Tricholoma furcatifolium]
ASPEPEHRAPSMKYTTSNSSSASASSRYSLDLSSSSSSHSHSHSHSHSFSSTRLSRDGSGTPILGMSAYRERRQTLRGGSAESALSGQGSSRRTLIGEELRAAGLSPSRRRSTQLQLQRWEPNEDADARGSVSGRRAATSLALYADAEEERRELRAARSSAGLLRQHERERSLARDSPTLERDRDPERGREREREREKDRDRQRQRPRTHPLPCPRPPNPLHRHQYPLRQPARRDPVLQPEHPCRRAHAAPRRVTLPFQGVRLPPEPHSLQPPSVLHTQRTTNGVTPPPPFKPPAPEPQFELEQPEGCHEPRSLLGADRSHLSKAHRMTQT